MCCYTVLHKKYKGKNNLGPHCISKYIKSTFNNDFDHMDMDKWGYVAKRIGHKRIFKLQSIK